MTFRELEAIDHGHIHYNLRGKLWEHILKRSEICFAKNAAVRGEIRTREALDAYAEAIHATSTSAIYKAVLTVFLTNGLAEALLAGIVTIAVAPPLIKIAKK